MFYSPKICEAKGPAKTFLGFAEAGVVVRGKVMYRLAKYLIPIYIAIRAVTAVGNNASTMRDIQWMLNMSFQGLIAAAGIL